VELPALRSLRWRHRRNSSTCITMHSTTPSVPRSAISKIDSVLRPVCEWHIVCMSTVGPQHSVREHEHAQSVFWLYPMDVVADGVAVVVAVKLTVLLSLIEADEDADRLVVCEEEALLDALDDTVDVNDMDGDCDADAVTETDIVDVADTVAENVDVIDHDSDGDALTVADSVGVADTVTDVDRVMDVVAENVELSELVLDAEAVDDVVAEYE
jgi:hypothetical protein